jgi:hypothetical protein
MSGGVEVECLETLPEYSFWVGRRGTFRKRGPRWINRQTTLPEISLAPVSMSPAWSAPCKAPDIHSRGVIAAKLKEGFGVTEEWGYIDRETKEHRSLDIFAFRGMPADGNIQARLALLIECKRSINPYVFFRNVVDREIPGFPNIGGLTVNSMFLSALTSNRSLQTSPPELLGLPELPFVRPGPPHCSAFGMATAQGDKVYMSGEDPYKSMILPLTNAMDHAASLYQAREKPTFLRPTLILGIGVIDAPMLVVNNPREPIPSLTPWVRVPRQEARVDNSWRQHVYYVIEVVHSDFFDEFVSDHLVPFFNEFAARVSRQSSVLLKGGIVANIDNWRWDEVNPKP